MDKFNHPVQSNAPILMKPISLNEFGDKRYRRFDSYQFAAKDALAPIVVKEMPKACLILPIGFAHIGEDFVPVVVQGLQPGKNLFVAPDGRWVARYVPAVYRGYPFALANTEDGRQVLCFQEESGLLSDEGEPFFDGEKPTKGVNDVLDFLTQMAANRAATARICALLKEHSLIQPWLIKIEDPEKPEAARNIEGLFRIDEAALNKLDKDALAALRDGGALPLVFCQLLSMQHLPVLGELAKALADAEQQAALPKNEIGEIDLTFLADDTTISFENL